MRLFHAHAQTAGWLRGSMLWFVGRFAGAPTRLRHLRSVMALFRWTMKERIVLPGNIKAPQLHSHKGNAEMLAIGLLHLNRWQRSDFQSLTEEVIAYDAQRRNTRERRHADAAS